MADSSNLPVRVVMIGYRGSGKTTFGRELARRLGYAFEDVDDAICDRFGGLSIAEIWRRHGEPAFRAMEVEVARELMRRERLVVGLGGGTLMQPGAREAVETAPATLRLYLKVDAAELCKRIHADPKSAAMRPALTTQGGGLDEIVQVLAQREPVYEAVADLAVDVADVSDPWAVVGRLEGIVRIRG